MQDDPVERIDYEATQDTTTAAFDPMHSMEKKEVPAASPQQADQQQPEVVPGKVGHST